MHVTRANVIVRSREEEKNGMTLRKIAENIKTKYGMGPSTSTIHHYVLHLNYVGRSPLKMGHGGGIEAVAYKALCTAFASMVRIQQLNGKAST